MRGDRRARGRVRLSRPIDAVAVQGIAPAESVLLQSGVLAYRRDETGEVLVLLVNKKKSKEWSIPKGRIESDLSFPENAAKEAYEEAGVTGSVSPNFVGRFRGTKRQRGRLGKRTIEVWVYLLEVERCLSEWPEKGRRQSRWVPTAVAATLLREPVLVELCTRLSNLEK